MSKTDVPVAEKLKRLYELQIIDSELDDIQILKGELPIEVADLEDEVAGLQLRVNKVEGSAGEIKAEINQHNIQIKDNEALVVKYQKQLDNVKNNREFEALTKELDLQKLEIQLLEKKVKELSVIVEGKQEQIDATKLKFTQKQGDLEVKKNELASIIAKTEKEEERLRKKSEKASKNIEDRLLKAYNKIRTSYPNKLAVVTVERNSCGGCFNKIPAQTQLEIGLRKKIIACEYCGRVLVDELILQVGQEVVVPA